MALEFRIVTPPLERLAKISEMFLEPKTLRLLILLTAFLLPCAIIFMRWRRASLILNGVFMEPGAADFTNPDTNAAPVDLTTMGADVNPDDHPELKNFNGGISPGKLAENLNGNWDSSRIGQKITEIEMRLDKQEGTWK